VTREGLTRCTFSRYNKPNDAIQRPLMSQSFIADHFGISNHDDK
jgi:hypothetical protein